MSGAVTMIEYQGAVAANARAKPCTAESLGVSDTWSLPVMNSGGPDPGLADPCAGRRTSADGSQLLTRLGTNRQ